MDVSIEGFQAVIEPVDIHVSGLTVVTGPSNVGKSATQRALKAALTNQRGSSFISNGSKKASVTVKSGSDELRWEKTGKSTEYWINGKDYLKAGTSTPEDIEKVMGFFPIKVDARVIYPQIKDQFDSPFLLNEKSSTFSAEVLTANKQTSVINLALKKARSDRLEQENQMKYLDGTIKALQDEEKLKSPIEASIRENCDKVAHLEVLESGLTSKVSSMESLRDSLIKLKAFCSVAIQDKLVSLDTRWFELNELNAKYTHLNSLTNIDLTELSKVDTRYVSLTSLRSQYIKSASISEVSLKEVSDVSPQLIEFISKADNLRKDWLSVNTLLGVHLNEVEGVSPALSNLWKTAGELKSQYDLKMKELIETSKELEVLDATIASKVELVKEHQSCMGSCVVCGREGV